jgi:hypothetical protein
VERPNHREWEPDASLRPFTWRGVTVTNPFSATPHALLRTLIGDDERDEVQEDDT